MVIKRSDAFGRPAAMWQVGRCLVMWVIVLVGIVFQYLPAAAGENDTTQPVDAAKLRSEQKEAISIFSAPGAQRSSDRQSSRGSHLQAESHALGGFHELNARDIRLPIASNAAVRPSRFGQQPFALIEPNSLHVDPCGEGKRTDRQVFLMVSHIACFRTYVRK